VTGSRSECQKMLKVVSEKGIRIKTNPFNGLRELSKAVELAHSGKMQGKPVVLIDQEAIKKQKESGTKMI
jgi:propanol-preferring alcohol dehydrogenase